MSPGNSKRKKQRNGEQRDCKLWDQQALKSLVGLLAQPFLQQKNEVTLEQFLLHKDLAPCFTANLHNNGTTKRKDVTHYGAWGEFYFSAVWMRE